MPHLLLSTPRAKILLNSPSKSQLLSKVETHFIYTFLRN